MLETQKSNQPNVFHSIHNFLLGIKMSPTSLKNILNKMGFFFSRIWMIMAIGSERKMWGLEETLLNTTHSEELYTQKPTHEHYWIWSHFCADIYEQVKSSVPRKQRPNQRRKLTFWLFLLQRDTNLTQVPAVFACFVASCWKRSLLQTCQQRVTDSRQLNTENVQFRSSDLNRCGVVPHPQSDFRNIRFKEHSSVAAWEPC